MEHARELRHLFDACAQGNVDVLNSLLDSGFDINATDEDDVTALQLAAANGQEQVVRLLLVRGAAVDQANVTGWTPLLHAARNGHSAVAALLIQNHASVNACTCYGAGVACLAARSGNLAICRLLEGAGVSFAAAAGHGDKSTVEISPLVVAAHRGHDSFVKHLLSSAEVNYPAKPMEITALMGAAIGGHVSTARLLVERGKADVDAVDINDKCALDYSIAQDRLQVKEYLKTKTSHCRHPAEKQTSPSIIEAVKSGNIEQVRDILDGDVSQRDAFVPQDGATPLMFSAMLGHLHIVKLLVEKGCSLNAQDVIGGWTALMQAIFHGRKEVAIYLIQAGADVKIPAKSGCTAFDMASVIGDVDTELYRLIASRALPVTAPQQMDISVRSQASSVGAVDRLQKTGIKAWWSRISKRFHNLKQPANFSSDVPELTEIAIDATLRNLTSTRLSTDDALMKSLTMNPLAAVADSGVGHFRDSVDYTVKGNTVLSLDASGVLTRGGTTTTLKSVVPPVFPSPSFNTDRTSKMPPASLRKLLSNHGNSQALSLTRPISSAVKLPHNQHSALNLVNRVASPPPRVQFAKRPAIKMPPQVDVSPSASCDAATLGSGSGDAAALPPISKVILSSASSSTLTAGSDNNGKTSPSVELLRTNCRTLQNRANPKQRESQSGQLTRNKLHNFDAANRITNVSSMSKDSGIDARVVQTKNSVDQYCDVSESDQTDLSGVLQKLSLECYQPIFEEQEVDMEAFLTLNDCDLKELGIKSRESRRQILATISELNANKDRERQLYQKVAANFSHPLQPQTVNSQLNFHHKLATGKQFSGVDPGV